MSNLRSRTEKSLTNIRGNQWTSLTNILSIPTRRNTSARYAEGASRKGRTSRMQFTYLYLVGRETSEVFKARFSRAKRFQHIRRAMQATCGGGKNVSQPRWKESHGACTNIDACIAEWRGEDSECLGLYF